MVSIFLSSTSKDLAKHRDAIITALMKAKLTPNAMEFFGARPGDAVDVSLSEVGKSDLFIGIYAHRYGYRPDGGKSVTEMEHDHAVKLGIDRLIFMVKPTYRKGSIKKHADDKNRDKKQRLEDFKKRLNSENVRAEFTTPDNLAIEVVPAVFHWFQNDYSPKEEADQETNQPSNTINITGDVKNWLSGNITTGDQANIHIGDKNS
jgi:hypothetical protein